MAKDHQQLKLIGVVTWIGGTGPICVLVVLTNTVDHLPDAHL